MEFVALEALHHEQGLNANQHELRELHIVMEPV